jgi:Na+/H+ antiporter NhaD/arsenite permease-like protein
MDTDKILAIAIFVLTYLLIIIFYHRKSAIVWAAAAALLLLKVESPKDALGAINWNVILLYFGMLFVSEVFLYSKMPDYLATLFASKTKSTTAAMLIICAFTGAISILLENVAVVLLVAPVALAISKKCDINPVPLFIGMAVSSNLQGTATLIGDPPSMLLGAFAKLNFNDFFVLDGKPGIFFAVQLGAITSLAVLYFEFRKYNKKMPSLEKEYHISGVPSVLVILLVACLILSSFIENLPPITAGLLCCTFGAVSLVWYVLHSKQRDVIAFTKTLDWQTGVFLIGIFILVKSLEVSGVIKDISQIIVRCAGDSPLSAFIIITGISVALSAFIDNIPFLVVMLPVTKLLTEHIGTNPYVFYFGLLIGASVGGNVTPIGASANIVAMGIVKKQGHHVSFFDFVKIGLPFTLAAVLASAAFVWFVFK